MMKLDKKLKVGILGATGMVGQRFITLLADHPWFEVTTLAASPRSAGKTYEDAVGDRWKMEAPMPESVKKMIVHNVNEVEAVASTVDFVFSAVDMTKEEIKKIEEDYAKTETPVVSNNSAHRWTPDVPMVVPEINPEHYEVIKYQKERLGTKRGFVAVKPNCSIQSYAPVLTAWKEFEPTEVVATTYQAISGAGKTFKDWPEMLGNIIPFIGCEEEKSDQEPLRLWGKIEDGVIKDIRFDGEACAICTASTSIMSELLIGKTIDEANVIIENYNNMIYEKDYDPEILEEAIAFMNTHKQANRIKCATLGWTGIKQILDKE